MEAGAALIGGLIGLAIVVVIGALLIMLGTKIVMGSAAQFGHAVGAVLLSAVAGFVIGFVIGFAVGASAPGQGEMAQIIAGIIGFLVTPWIYSMTLRTNDGRQPNYVQGLLIYLVQLAVVIAIAILLAMVFGSAFMDAFNGAY